LRAFLHSIFPNWVAAPHSPSEMDYLEGLIASQYATMLDKQVAELEARANARKHEAVYNDLKELRSKMISEVDSTYAKL